MAKADWCTVAPMSGNGNGTLTISAPAHTGRTQRSTAVTVQNQTGEKPSATIQVIQAGAPVATTMDKTTPDVPGSGGTATIRGVSNSETFELLSMWFAYPGVTCELQINDASPFAAPTESGMADVTIPGDPGATMPYNFTLFIAFPQSPLTTSQSLPVTVTDSGGKSVSCAVLWLPGASAVSVEKDSLALQSTGNSDTVGITSNDDWKVS